MKLAFYIFGTTNFQDMFPIIFSALKRGDDCWVSFYDIFNAKRQLYNYTLEEVESFFKEKCELKASILLSYLFLNSYSSKIKYLRDFQKIK